MKIFLSIISFIFVTIFVVVSAAQERSGIVTFQAEDAKLVGSVRVEREGEGFSGTGYVIGFEKEGDACVFEVSISTAGFYDMNFVQKSFPDQFKENIVTVDDKRVGTVTVKSGTFTNSLLRRIYLEEGTRRIALINDWGWISLDKLQLKRSAPPPKDWYEASSKLVNPNANENARRLMHYLADGFGKRIVSGQAAPGGILGPECRAILKETGRLPAMLAFDFIDVTESNFSRGPKDSVVKNALEFDRMGGIVTICWHWHAPDKYITGEWYKAFYTAETNIDLKAIMDGDDKEGYELLLTGIDAAAGELKTLCEAGVPILWRPLHEASGTWFWWGAAGPEAYKKLWNLIYRRLTEHHSLNNLIWVWNGQAADWYPGDDTVDIIGEDVYGGDRDYASQSTRFIQAKTYTKAKKLIVLSENGPLFDPDLAFRDDAAWGYFGTWHGDFVVEKNDEGYIDVYCEKHTEKEMLKKVYRHDKIVTLDKLPDLRTYPLATW